MKGNLFALATAVAWASAVVLFRKSGEHLSPFRLNALKSVLSLLLVLATLKVAGVPVFPTAPFSHLALLLASGLVGIAVADTLFFESLALLGAARSAIVSCLYAPFIVAASMLFLGERPAARVLGGGLFVVSAVFLTQVPEIRLELPAAALRRGVLLGAASMASTAVAIVAVKPLLPQYPVLWATGVRLLGGVLGLALPPLLHAPSRSVLGAFVPQRAWWLAIPAAVLGTYLALLLWVAGFKYGAASSTAILNQTSTLFTVMLSALFLRERFTKWHGIATGLAFVGAALVAL
ncbi:MAG TPA: DMT family transporter [Anaeromyxobacter sp.]|nr:DMT family transporter [Anaeromyxobacter sp.]